MLPLYGKRIEHTNIGTNDTFTETPSHVTTSLLMAYRYRLLTHTELELGSVHQPSLSLLTEPFELPASQPLLATAPSSPFQMLRSGPCVVDVTTSYINVSGAAVRGGMSPSLEAPTAMLGPSYSPRPAKDSIVAWTGFQPSFSIPGQQKSTVFGVMTVWKTLRGIEFMSCRQRFRRSILLRTIRWKLFLTEPFSL